MKRDIYKDFEKWKKSHRRKPLILNGARQVGKTYSLKYFANNFYKKTAYLNFEKDEKLYQYFKTTLDPKQLIKMLSIHTQVDIEPKNTLIIFDEIQESPEALNSLKYFCEEANEYHIATAGSLLGIKTAQEKGFPVGKVNFLTLYPLSFFEFLSAIKYEKLRSLLENHFSFQPIADPLHEKLIRLLKLYLFIGGMPEAVYEYAHHENLNEIRDIHLEILSAYEKDFAKHAASHEIMKITTVWKQVHKQLAKENKKFVFSAIRKSARSRDYEQAIEWLLNAGLIYKSYFTPSPKFPISAYTKNNIFKIFLMDVGLLGAMSNLSAKTIIDTNFLFTEFKGALTENFIAQELTTIKQKLYYWESCGTAKIDFLLETDHEIYPLEVKSGNSQKKKSLIVYKNKYLPSKLIKAAIRNFKKDNNIYNFPLYCICRFPKIFEKN